MALEIIQSQTLVIKGIFALPDWIAQNSHLLSPLQSKVESVTEKELERISNLKTPNKVFCICETPNYYLNEALINESLTLYLDDIQDPGNMGSILRIADWFGLPYVFCSNACVEAFNTKVIQASMGAFLRVKVPVIELSALKVAFPDLPIFASILGGTNIFTAKLPKKGILVIGNEGKGVSDKIKVLADHHLTIPKNAQGGAESLNAAVATGIICSVLLNR